MIDRMIGREGKGVKKTVIYTTSVIMDFYMNPDAVQTVSLIKVIDLVRDTRIADTLSGNKIGTSNLW